MGTDAVELVEPVIGLVLGDILDAELSPQARASGTQPYTRHRLRTAVLAP
jgi:hypothetical protein